MFPLSKKMIRSVFVLGSTSEVAMAICVELARKGCKRFHLVARNEGKNKQFADELRESFYADVTEELIDSSTEFCKIAVAAR